MAVYSQDSTDSLRCMCHVTMNKILQEHSPPFSFGVDELSILKRWTLPRRWCLNPAYHREAITSEERSFFSKEPSRFRHDELCETRIRYLVPLDCSYRSPLCYSEWFEELTRMWTRMQRIPLVPFFYEVASRFRDSRGHRQRIFRDRESLDYTIGAIINICPRSKKEDQRNGGGKPVDNYMYRRTVPLLINISW